MIEKFAPELLDEVFSYCSVKDLLNVACCSQRHYSSVKHLLWRKVKIPLSHRETASHIFQNLKHTVDLHLDGAHRMVNDKYDDHEDYEGDWEENNYGCLSKDFHSGFNYGRLLYSCNPQILRRLTLGHISEEAVHYALEVFHDIEYLSLRFLNIMNWSSIINNLPKLRKLSLCCLSYYPNSFGITNVLEKNKLEVLYLDWSGEIAYNVFLYISKASNLRQLSYFGSGWDESSKSDIKHLSALKDLTYLNIDKTYIIDDSLIHLCRSLKKLKVLKLSRSIFTDNGLSEACLLTSLVELDISYCHGIGANCFIYISLLESLRSLTFTASIFPTDNVDGTSLDKVSRLNMIPTLKEIVVVGTLQKVAVILKALCLKRRWGLQIESLFSIDFDRYILLHVY